MNREPSFDSVLNCFRIPLSQNKEALVDTIDLPKVEGRKWWYAKHKPKRGEVITRNSVRLSHVIAGPSVGQQVQHRNSNVLDCRRSNLRKATRSEASRFAKKRVGTSSKYKGVCFDNARQRWRAYINIEGLGRWWLGRFDTEEAAARAYDKVAAEHFGEFARLNLTRGS